MKIKRIIAAVTAAVMLSVGVTGCSGDSGKLKIGISKMMIHDAMDRAEEDFKKALLDKG